MLKNPTHTYKKAGIYNIKLIAIDSASCNFSDSITKQITDIIRYYFSLTDINLCKGEKIQIGLNPFNDTTITYKWVPAKGLSDPLISNPYAFPDSTVKYMLLVSNKVCTDTIYQNVLVHNITLAKLKDTASLLWQQLFAEGNCTGTYPLQYQWSSTNDFNNSLNSNPNNNTALIQPKSRQDLFHKSL